MLHYTGMRSTEAAIARLRDPAAKVSCHWLIADDGQAVAMVPEDRRAWHAGVSHWRGSEVLNDTSVGIELVNPGHANGYRPFPRAQIETLVRLAGVLRERWSIPADGVLAHSDIAFARKLDPGERLPWTHLAEAGLGCMPADMRPVATDHAVADTLLRRIGFAAATAPRQARQRIAAFQRRYRSRRVDGLLDPETMGALIAVERLLARAGEPRWEVA